MNDDTIVFYDAQADSQRRIPKASVVGGRFGDAPFKTDAILEDIVEGSQAPLIHLPFDQSLENLGSETVEIARNGTLPFSDDPRGETKKSILSTGSGSYIRIHTTPILNTLTEFSISFWFRSLDIHRPQYLVSKWKAAYLGSQTADGAFTIGYTNPGGRLFIFLVDQNGGYHPYPIDNAIQDNLSWNHVVVSFGNQQLNIYVNGNLISSNDINYELYQDNSSDLLLMTAIYRDTNDEGKVEEDLSTFNLIGQMDDFRLWSQVISAEDVRNLYRNSYSISGY
ncbi:MAG: LamG domain-containing protein, partial [Spirochaetota bacterium]